MTLTQLRALVMVARLGSVRAAAEALGVSSPAVSSAVAGLRAELGDELLVRDGTGVVLTAGGRRVAARGAEILGLAEQMRRAVGEVAAPTRTLRVAATSEVAEHVVPTVVELLAARLPGLLVEVAVHAAEEAAEVLLDRRADVALGPAIPATGATAYAAAPFLRYRVGLVAAPGHPLHGRPTMSPRRVLREPWLTGPDGLASPAILACWLTRRAALPASVRVLPTHDGAIAAAAAGDGVAPAVLHTVRRQVGEGRLVLLDVEGLPLTGRWHLTTLAADRLPPAVTALRRLLSDPTALRAIVARRTGTAASRLRSSVYVTLWS